MTRWQLTNLPVYVAGRPHPIGAVRGVWPDWETRRIAALSLGARPWGVPVLALTETVRIEADGVRVVRPSQIERRARSWLNRQEAADWYGRRVVDGRGRVLGRVADVDFRPRDGAMAGVWVTRGVAADLWRGMLWLDIGAVLPVGGRIVVSPVGEAGT